VELKSVDDRRLSAVIMLTAKAAEGCEPCLAGYKRAAQEAGASQRDIDLALAAGARAQQQRPADATPDHPDASLEVVGGPEADAFFKAALANDSVHKLEAELLARGYRPVEAARGMARLRLGQKRAIEAYLPYELDADHFGWIDFKLVEGGTDIVAMTVDLTLRDQVAAGRPIHDSLIVQDGTVVQGHECDGNNFWDHLLYCCGPGAFYCIGTGPFWWACVTTVCGFCAILACWSSGCCG
jgi:AhpD family alkylhydroperoxidase